MSLSDEMRHQADCLDAGWAQEMLLEWAARLVELEALLADSPGMEELDAAAFVANMHAGELSAARVRVAELEAKLTHVYTWAAGLCVSHPHLVPRDIAYVDRYEALTAEGAIEEAAHARD